MPKRTRKKSIRRRWLPRLAVAFAALVLLSVGLTLPLRWFNPPTTVFMLSDDSGLETILYEWVDWERLGSAAALAVVAAEDQKFADHHGFDLDSIRKSIDAAQGGGRLRGASTISQQVAKNLFLWRGRSFLRKGVEAYFTVLLEAFLPKRRILEIYLNVAAFGPGVYGAAAASRLYFGKSPSQLTDREAALMAAVLPNPRRYFVDRPSAHVRERQAWILGQMRRLRHEGWITRLR